MICLSDSTEDLKDELDRKNRQYSVCNVEITWQRLERECRQIIAELKRRGAI